MFDLFGGEILAALLLVVVVLAHQRLAAFLNLVKTELRAADWIPVARRQAPAHVQYLLAQARPGLAELGFRPVAALGGEPLNGLDPRPLAFADLYWHPELGVLARAELAEPLTGQVIRVQFFTLYRTGRGYMTVNRELWAFLPVPPEITVEDAHADDLAGQWQVHQAMLKRLGPGVAPVTDLAAVLRWNLDFGLGRWLAWADELGWVRPAAPGRYRFTVRGAWRYAAQLSRPPAPARAALARPYRQDPAPDLAAVRLAEMDGVAAHLALEAQPGPTWMKGALFVGTLVLSALLFGGGFGVVDAAALLLVLLVHELGHLGAMAACGYRNLSIFFLPLLGAAAAGYKPEAPPWQEALVLLAGPVTGLLVTLLLVWIPAPGLPETLTALLRSCVWFGLFLNLFNLLPFGILDGGRLFELALLGRFPQARVWFAVLGTLVGLLFAIWSGSLLFGLAMLLLLAGVPSQLRAARLIQAIRGRAKARGLSALTGEQALRALGRQFARGDPGGQDAKGWARRLILAKLAYPRLLQGVPSLVLSLGVLGSHLAALALPLALVAWSWRQPQPLPLWAAISAARVTSAPSPETQASRAAFMARYQAETSPGGRWALLAGAELDPVVEAQGYEPSFMAWLEAERQTVLAALPPDHPAQLRRRVERAEPGAPETLELLLAVADRLAGRGAGLDAEGVGVLVEVGERLAQEAPRERWDAPLAGLEALWLDLMAVPADEHLVWRGPLAQAGARLALAAGRVSEADRWMARSRAGDPSPELSDLTQAWYLLDSGRLEQALELARQAGSGAGNSSRHREQWRILTGWAELTRGQPREADREFQAVLALRAERLTEAQAAIPWWLRLISGSAATSYQELVPIDAATLDHLAALEAYDPQGESRLRAELGARLGPEQRARQFQVQSRYGGWGLVRERVHDRLLQSFGLARRRAASGA